MRLRFGRYIFPIGTAGFTIDREAQKTKAGITWGFREVWNINGLIYNRGGKVADMDEKVAALELAFATGGYDAALTTDGTTKTRHVLRDAACIGGVQIAKPLSYPSGVGPEYVTMRTFNVAIEGTYLVGSAPEYDDFQEAVSFVGGGPLFGLLEPLRGKPIKQQWKEQTIYRATQRGRAVGLLSYPEPPPPLWPEARPRPQERPFTYEPPERLGDGNIRWPVSWEYQFESPTALTGLPHTL